MCESAVTSTRACRPAFVLAACVVLSACGGPTTPGGCDERAAQLRVECTPAGADLQCRAYRQDGGYCADPAGAEVTGDARWFTSDSRVGFFAQPGAFQTRSPGDVSLHAEYSLFLRSDPQAFTVAPGRPPERLASIQIGVRDAVTRAFLTDARVEIVSQAGDLRTCLTNEGGECRVWTQLSPLRVVVTRSGYQRAERTLEPRETCYCASELIELTRAR
jgi:hypothetical protein